MAHLYLVDSAVTTVFKFSCNVFPMGEGVDSAATVPAVAVHMATERRNAVWTWNMFERAGSNQNNRGSTKFERLKTLKGPLV